MALGGGAALAGRAAVEVYPDLANFQKELTAKLAPITGKMGKFSKGSVAGIAGITVAGAAAGKVLYDIGAKFDDATDTIQVKTGATGKHLEKLKGDFKAVYASVPSDSKAVADAIGDLNRRLGLTGKPLQNMSRQVLDLSRITSTDLQANIKGISRAFVDWEVPLRKQSRTLDGFFKISERSGASVEELTTSVQQFGSPLRQLGFHLDEAASLFANFERAGVNTQTMVPGLKLAISNLTRPTGALSAEMSKFGIAVGKPDKALRQVFALMSKEGIPTAEKTGLAMDVFGRRAGADMAEAIKQGRFNVQGWIKDFRSAGGAIEDTTKDTDDFAQNWDTLKHKLEVAVSPAATFVFDRINQGMSALTRLDLSHVLDSLRQFWKESGVVRTVVGALLDTAHKTFDGFKQAATGAFDVVKGAVKIVSGVLTGDWSRAWDGVKDIFKGSIKIVAGTIKMLTAPIRSVAKIIGGAFSGPWEKVKGIFSDGVGVVTGFINLIIDALNAIPGVDIGHVGGKSGVKVHNRDSYKGPASNRPMNPIGHAIGGKVMTPTAIVGEEAPRHPEYVIATNPAYRKRNLGLFASAGAELGIPGFAAGGLLPNVNVPVGPLGPLGPHVDVGTSGVNLDKGAAIKGAEGLAKIIKAFPSVANLPDWLKNAGLYALDKAKDFAKDKIPGLFKGGILKYNRAFPKTTLGGGGKRLSPTLTAAIAEYAGLPGVTFAQIARGESGYYPGMVSSDGGYGMWQMTPRVWDGALRDKISRIGSYFNPLANAKMAKALIASGAPLSSATWHGSQYVTGWNQHYKGKINAKTPNTKGKGSRKAKTLGIGGLQNQIDATSNAADKWSDYAERADTIGESVFGFDQLHWLQAELFELLKLRDLLLTAMQKLREQLAALQASAKAKIAKAVKGAPSAAAGGGGKFFDKVKAFTDEVPLGKYLQSMGYQVGEHPAFGGVDPVHAAGSYHYAGRAIDVNHDQSNEKGWLNKLYAPLKQNKNVVELLWQVKDHYDHLHVAFAQGGMLGKIGGAFGGIPAFKKGGKKGKGTTPKSKAAKKAQETVNNQISAYRSKIDEIGSTLVDLQGIGSPMTIGGTFNPGDLGGRILDVQQSIKDYGGDGEGSSGATDDGPKGLSLDAFKSIIALRDLGVKFSPDQFAGFFARGGKIGAGQWGIAGEKGPEPVFGPATVVPNGALEIGGNGEGFMPMIGDLYIGGEKIDERVEVRMRKREREQSIAGLAGSVR